MFTIQYMHCDTIESLRLPMDEALEYAKALKAKGIFCQIVG